METMRRMLTKLTTIFRVIGHSEKESTDMTEQFLMAVMEKTIAASALSLSKEAFTQLQELIKEQRTLEYILDFITKHIGADKVQEVTRTISSTMMQQYIEKIYKDLTDKQKADLDILVSDLEVN